MPRGALEVGTVGRVEENCTIWREGCGLVQEGSTWLRLQQHPEEDCYINADQRRVVAARGNTLRKPSRLAHSVATCPQLSGYGYPVGGCKYG
mmetsp:Transcript_52429/g.106908  ORF Transcript_52429/g.106908 Transcript_52429/m.106908 type:complete len:92 (-) Transcript_52429:1148-1423(-)